MSTIMELIGPELTIYKPIRSRISWIIGQIEQEYQELFAFEFGKIAEYDFVYTLIIYKY